MSFIEIVLPVAAIITALSGLVVTIPQMARVLRTKQAPGVSLPGWVSWCVSYTAWTVYLLWMGQIPLFLGCLAESVVCLVTTIVVLRNASSFRDRAWWTTGIWAVTITAALVAYQLGAPMFVSALLSCSPLWVYGPSAVKAWRSKDVSGIAPATWILALTGAVTFAVAGYQNPVTVANGATSATLSLVILARLYVETRRAQTPTVPVVRELALADA